MTCTLCSSGQYQPKPAQSSCLPCAIGQAQELRGQSKCISCVTGSYTLVEGSRTCASCQGRSGLMCTGGRVNVDEGYYGWIVSVEETSNSSSSVVGYRFELRTSVCGGGSRCKGGDWSSNDYTPCTRDRNQSLTNVLCGRCRDHYIEFGSTCVECTKTDAGLLVLVIMFLFLVTSILHVVAQSTSGLPSIFFYFGILHRYISLLFLMID
jgi:hypothetical protein